MATKLALEEIQHGVERESELQQERGWKLLPRMMFHRSPRGGHIPKAKLVARFDKFAAGQWRERDHVQGVAQETCQTDGSDPRVASPCASVQFG